MRRLLTLLVLLTLVSCEGPSYPQSPTAPPQGLVLPTRVTLAFSPPELPIGGGATTIRIETSASNGYVVAPRARVALTASEGTLEHDSVMTDETGHGSVGWSGTLSSTITAIAGEAQTSAEIRVLTPAPPFPQPGPPTPTPTPPSIPVPPPPPAPPPAERPDPNLVLTITTTPATPVANQATTLKATLSTVDGSTPPAITRYAWDVNADALPDFMEASPVVTFTSVGPQRILLEVGTATPNVVARVDQTLTVVATAPIPPPVLAVTLTVPDDTPGGPPRTMTVGVSGTFTATVTGLAAGETVETYEWDFDTATPALDAMTAVNTRAHTYTTFGTKTATVRIRTSTGRTLTSAPVSVDVLN